MANLEKGKPTFVGTRYLGPLFLIFIATTNDSCLYECQINNDSIKMKLKRLHSRATKVTSDYVPLL